MSKINKEIINSQLEKNELNHLLNRVVTTLKFLTQNQESIFNNANYTPYLKSQLSRLSLTPNHPQKIILEQIEKITASSEIILKPDNATKKMW